MMNKEFAAKKADQEVAGLREQADNIVAQAERKASTLRTEADCLAAIRRQEIINKLSGGESLWTVKMSGYTRTGLESGRDQQGTVVVSAPTAQVALECADSRGLLMGGEIPLTICDKQIVIQ